MPWWQVAMELVERARQGGPPARPNIYAYTSAMTACARAGQWAPALAMLDEMEAQGMAADVVAFNSALHA